MVPAEVIRDRSNDFAIAQSEASKIFLMGLQALQENDGEAALENFQKVAKLQPNTPYINVLIERSKELPGGHRLTASNGENSRNKNFNFNIPTIVPFVEAYIIVCLLAYIIFLLRKLKKTK